MQMEKRFDNLDGKVDKLDTQVGSLEAKVDNLDIRVGSLETKVDKLDTRVGSLEVKVDRLDGRVGDLEVGVSDLHEAVNLFSERTDERFYSLEQRVAALPTRTEMRELVQDVVDRSWDRALAKVKQVDMHVDAVVDTLAEEDIITPSAKAKLHAMQPFPKLVKET